MLSTTRYRLFFHRMLHISEWFEWICLDVLIYIRIFFKETYFKKTISFWRILILNKIIPFSHSTQLEIPISILVNSSFKTYTIHFQWTLLFHCNRAQEISMNFVNSIETTRCFYFDPLSCNCLLLWRWIPGKSAECWT